jgi:hypothetical protein
MPLKEATTSTKAFRLFEKLKKWGDVSFQRQKDGLRASVTGLLGLTLH